MLVIKYPSPMRWMHWTMSLIIIAMLIVGFLMTGWWSDKPFTGDLYFWHKSFGVLVLILVTARIAMRTGYGTRVPPLSMILRPYERWLASLVHTLLYVFMVVMPVSGFLTSSIHPKSPGVPFFFGYFPDPFTRSEAWAAFFASIHNNSAYCLLALLFLHVAGVIKHRLFDPPESDSLRKML